MTRRPRVLVVDDHTLLRQGVVATIGDSVEVVGEADDVGSAIAAIRTHRPEVVLLDVHLPSGSGAEVIGELREELPEVRYLALSVSDAPDDVLGLVRAGARGYVTKRIDGPGLVEAILQVASGDAVFSPRLAGFVLDAFARTGPEPESGPGSVAAPPKPESASGAASLTEADPVVGGESGRSGAGGARIARDDLDRLTAREREVMQHLARGYSYKEIATELVISVRTVESHASAVLRKLQLSSRNELAHWANRQRLL